MTSQTTLAGPLVGYDISPSSADEKTSETILSGSLVGYEISSSSADEDTSETNLLGSLVAYEISSSSADEDTSERNERENRSLITCGACCQRNTLCVTNCRFSAIFPDSTYQWMFFVMEKLNLVEAYFTEDFMTFPKEAQIKKFEGDFLWFYEMIKEENSHRLTAEVENLRYKRNANPIVRDEVREEFRVYMEKFIKKMALGLTSDLEMHALRMKILVETESILQVQVNRLGHMRDQPFDADDVFTSLVEFLINKISDGLSEGEMLADRVDALNKMQTKQLDQLEIVSNMLQEENGENHEREFIPDENENEENGENHEREFVPDENENVAVEVDHDNNLLQVKKRNVTFLINLSDAEDIRMMLLDQNNNQQHVIRVQFVPITAFP